MSENALYRLMTAGQLSPLSYYFARFIARGCGASVEGLLGRTAALVSTRNLHGDVCVDLARYAGRPFLAEHSEEPITIPPWPPLNDWLDALAALPWVGTPTRTAPLILEGPYLYLEKYWRFENAVGESIGERMVTTERLDRARLAEGLARLFAQSRADRIDWQKVAAAIAVSRRFAVISGGPGTGKTTTVVKVLALLLEQDEGLRIGLAAPTGKAAARLSAAVRSGKGQTQTDAGTLGKIPEQASTVHRLLGMGADNRFLYHRDNPLMLDCLVVDEASMIDLPLMARLLEALPQRTRIILVGDRDQLASVEAGSVLGDITGHGRQIRYSPSMIAFLEEVGAAPPTRLHGGESSVCPSDAAALLRMSHRFSARSGIGLLSRTVNAGEGEAALRLFTDDRLDDITWLDGHAGAVHSACLHWAAAQYIPYLQQHDVGDGLRHFEQARLLAALHRGPFGVDEINRRIAAHLQARKLIDGGEEYHGKPIMVTANDYEIGLFNGDIGLLWRDEEQGLRAYFPLPEGGVRRVSVRQLPEHRCAYALTVHKSQGSEFDRVLLVLPYDWNPLVTRELIYTGITRARSRITIHSSRATFIEGCRSRVQRGSGLAQRLGWQVTAARQA